MKCLVTISGADGATYRSAGDASFENGTLELGYTLDGDECRLTACGKEVRETRRGEVNLDLLFIEGANTAGILRDGNRTGEFPIFTDSVRLRKTPVGAKLELDYDCGGEKISLRLTAEYIEDEK